jgi:hypothetical protein
MKLILRCLSFYIILIFSGCTQYCNTVCTAEAPIIFVGYPNSDLDSIVLNAYTGNDSFNNLIYTKVFHADSLTGITGDTTYIAEDLDVNEDGGANTGYEVIIPADNKTYKITNINYTGDVTQKQVDREGTCDPGNCFRNLSSYTLNGNTVTSPNPSGTAVYLVK